MKNYLYLRQSSPYLEHDEKSLKLIEMEQKSVFYWITPKGEKILLKFQQLKGIGGKII